MTKYESSYIDVDIRKAETSDIGGMLSIFGQAFDLRNPRLAQLMYTEDPSVEALSWAVDGILKSHLNHQDCRFMVAYDTEDQDPIEYNGEEIDVNSLTFGWISVSIVPSDASRDSYLASELNTYASLQELEQVRIRGEHQPTIHGPRSRLLHELVDRSVLGQAMYTHEPHLVVNGLVCWPDLHRDTYREMTSKLLAWALNFAERRGLPIWSQILADQKGIFRRAGFREVRSFNLNLDEYKPHGSANDWGTQEWVQMIYARIPGGRSARSASPGNRGERSRRVRF